MAVSLRECTLLTWSHCTPARGSLRQAGWLQTGRRYRITLMKWLGISRDNVQAHMHLIVGAVLRYRHANDKIPGFSKIPAPPREWQWSDHNTISAVFFHELLKTSSAVVGYCLWTIALVSPIEKQTNSTVSAACYTNLGVPLDYQNHHFRFKKKVAFHQICVLLSLHFKLCIIYGVQFQELLHLKHRSPFLNGAVLGRMFSVFLSWQN